MVFQLNFCTKLSIYTFISRPNAKPENDTAVLAAGNFALTAVLRIKLATIAAKYLSNFEMIDYVGQGKKDAPSGTVAELANKLSKVRKFELKVPIADTIGNKETRGGNVDGVQVHAVRLSGHTLASRLFLEKDEKMIINHDAGSSADPYVKGIFSMNLNNMDESLRAHCLSFKGVTSRWPLQKLILNMTAIYRHFT